MDIEDDVEDVGLFESLRRHVLDEGLTDRFRSRLREFETKHPAAFDVYIMACYVSQCRTPVSVDMIYMFLGKRIQGHSELYKEISKIDEFLIEVQVGDGEETSNQDHFLVRSNALAKIALRECGQKAFSRVFDRFHQAVPARVIVDYPTFRRYSYDNDHARRAYPQLENGLAFYERLVRATDNAYDYQHGAIYLSKMGAFKDAFNWIDTALSKSKGRVFSIRNTHARILFEANIGVLRIDNRNKTAIDGIKESMDVLEKCIADDARRAYHLLRFSDQALQYSAIMNDLRAINWVDLALGKLKEAAAGASVRNSRDSYNLRKYRSLIKQIESSL